MTDTNLATLPCCPEMTQDTTCDLLDFHYRMNYPVSLREFDGREVLVEVKLHFQLKRCPGPLASWQPALYEILCCQAKR